MNLSWEGGFERPPNFFMAMGISNVGPLCGGEVGPPWRKFYIVLFFLGSVDTLLAKIRSYCAKTAYILVILRRKYVVK